MPETSVRLRHAAICLVLTGTAFLPACEKKVSGSPQARGEAIPVLAAQVTREDLPITYRAVGTVEAYRTVEVGARVTGTLLRVHFREGQEVRKGDPLFSIDPRPYEVAVRAAEAELSQVEAKAATSSIDAQRSRMLVREGLVSEQEHRRVAAAAAADSAAVLGARASVEVARLNLGYCSIEAPLSGRTSNLLVHEGNLVRGNATEPLVVINQIEPVYVGFSLPERRLPEVMRYAMEAGPLTVEAAHTQGSEDRARGKLVFIDNAVDPESGTILLKAEFSNAGRSLWPGEFVEVILHLTRRIGAVVVPAVAVQTGQRGDYCMVIKEDLTTEVRPVTVAMRLNDRAVLESGLVPGETVVTDGHLRIVPGAKVAIRPGPDADGSAISPAAGPASR